MKRDRRELPAPRGKALAATIVLAVALLAILALLDKPLRTEVAGSGTISLELAGDPQRAGEIVASWEAVGERERAAFIDGLDFLFAALYAVAIAGACLAVRRRLREKGYLRLASPGIALAWLALAAGAFDWAENVSLAVVLLDEPASPWPEIAFACGLPKFALSDAGILFALLGGAVSLAARPRPAPAGPEPGTGRSPT